MKFRCERYPSLIVWSDNQVLAQFANGEVDTDDKRTIDALRRVPEVKQVGGRPSKDRDTE